MQCEICEKGIERGKKVKLEGSIVVACKECSKYGEVVEDAKIEKPKPRQIKKVEEERPKFNLSIEEELVEGYDKLIKDKRESIGMKQEELAKRINEPSSLVHRIESGRFEPSPKVARKIQTVLGVSLLEKVEPEEPGEVEGKAPDELTLGDMVFVKNKRKQ